MLVRRCACGVTLVTLADLCQLLDAEGTAGGREGRPIATSFRRGRRMSSSWVRVAWWDGSG
eukprot:4710335-Alexandrium_andersonii.AAC.1